MMGLKKIALCAVLATIVATPAMAQDGGKQMYVGGLIGLVLPMADGADSDLTFGGEFGYKLDSTMAVGLYFTTFGNTETFDILGTDVEVSSSSSILSAFFDYYFDPSFSAGVMLGLAMGSAETGGVSTSSSDLGFGARVGYDIEVADSVTVGPNANIFLSTADGADPVINVLGAIKYHF